MKFDRLRLIGFKSFVEPTDVMIEPGLTGVVGPNGCGKSNLVEALRWVMGEASYKSVRGSSMDDVIFAGSGRRPTRDTAEVTLFLDNTARTAPAEMNAANDLEVTRRISRGVGSDYRVNGRPVRARDVQILFADAATGSRSPSMVRQGQVAELIAAKPIDRRNILEEAAGISGLRARKHEAALKLNGAEQNLSRVEDVAGEVERQVETLRRQARQAARYRTLSDEIRTLDATVHHLRWIEARGAVADGERAMAVAETAISEAAARQVRSATDEAAAQHALPAMRASEAAAASARQEAVAALAALDAKDREITEKLDALKRHAETLTKDLSRQDAARADAAQAVARLSNEAADLVRANEGAETRIAALEQAAADAVRTADEAERVAVAATERAAAVSAARAAADEARSRASRDAETAGAEVRRLEASLAAARHSDAVRRKGAALGALAEAERREADAARAEAAAQADEATAADVVGRAETALAASKAAETSAQAELATLEAEIAERKTEAKALARLTETLSRGEGAVLEDCTVAAGYETAFAAALGDDLQAPVSPGAPARWAEDTAATGDPALPDGVEPLALHVGAPPALARRLAQVGIIEDGGLLLARLAPGQRLVSRAGALWRWDGFAQDAGVPNAAAERLAQKNRLAALAAEIAAIEPRRTAAAANLATARTAVAEAADREAEARRTQMAVRQSLAAARRALGDSRATSAQAKARVGEAEAKARAAETTQARLVASLEAAEATAANLARALAAAEAALAAASPGAAEAKDRDVARTAAQDAGRRSADAANAVEAEQRFTFGRSRRLERLSGELTDWQDRLAAADQHRSDLGARLAATTQQRDVLGQAPSETTLERRRLGTALAQAEARESAARNARADGEAAERGATEAAREALAALSRARETSARAEERLSAARERLAEVEAALTEALDVKPHGAARLAGLDPTAPLPNRGEIEKRHERLKAERERLGGINLCAEDELRDVEDRRGTMLAERDDLLAAIETLRLGIRELNREARERLVASFDHVNVEFKRLFSHLFGGGEADLVLTEAEDPLDAGLDIIARPPGKKPQVLSLLSGGEQTLTATALIFAVFLTNPAPICVLDEIDAPLDDANVERFCHLLDEMTRATDTRFLIITHNPITMARMHRLYGVTMVEKGVSQLVSVSLEAAEELRESA